MTQETAEAVDDYGWAQIKEEERGPLTLREIERAIVKLKRKRDTYVRNIGSDTGFPYLASNFHSALAELAKEMDQLQELRSYAKASRDGTMGDY